MTPTLTTVSNFPRYSVNKLGQVWSERSQKFLTHCISTNGYAQVTLSNGDGRKWGYKKLVHVLVWEAHNGEVPAGLELDHIDRNPLNNCISNLRLATRSANLLNSGHKGVCLRKNKYVTRLTVDGKTKQLGTFLTFDEAHACYLAHKSVAMHHALSAL